MADPPPYPDSRNDTADEPDPGSTTGTPRWVKVFGVIAIVVVLLFIVMMLVGAHDPSKWGHG